MNRYIIQNLIIIVCVMVVFAEPVKSQDIDIENNIENTPSLIRSFAFSQSPFASDSAFNHIATQERILPKSGEQILVTYRVLRGDTTTLSPGLGGLNWPFMDINYDNYTMPIFRMGSNKSSVLIRDYYGNLGWTNPKLPIDKAGGPVTVPAPAGYIRPAGPQNIDADGHLILYNPKTFLEYDFWQATTVKDSSGHSLGGGRIGTKILEAGMIDYFNTTKSGTNPDKYYSARATGVPLLAGLILPEDIKRGVIKHALVFAIPGLRNTATNPEYPKRTDYFYPASITEVYSINKNPNSLAAGQRIRLRQTIVNDKGIKINESKLAPITRIFLTALRTYGAYLVDSTGTGFSFYAEDVHTAPFNITNDQVNRLIGKPPGTPLPNMPKWQIVNQKLSLELEHIPIAYGPWVEGQDPSTATITTSNFDVIEPIIWKPSLNTSWQWQLTGAINQSYNVKMYDIDMFDNSANIVKSLHSKSRKVVCYISAGSWEDWRPDAYKFPAYVLGNPLEGWEGERWLDIRRIDIIGPIMKTRMDLCKNKGFDGIEPDNIDGYTADTGFPLTYNDEINYNKFLAREAHARGLSIGLKNDIDQIGDLLPYFDWTLNEECFYYKECKNLTKFINASKAVFQVEYLLDTNNFCPQANKMNFNSMKKHWNLDAWRKPCRGP